jgi:hypothetical protein
MMAFFFLGCRYRRIQPTPPHPVTGPGGGWWIPSPSFVRLGLGIIIHYLKVELLPKIKSAILGSKNGRTINMEGFYQ